MANMNIFPLSAGFLFPNGEFFSTEGRGHQRLAYRILEEKFGLDTLDIHDPEYMLQEEYSAILIRYRWGEKLVYLPKKAPPTIEGKFYFKKAVKFYISDGFQVLNLYKISLENDFSTIEQFVGEQYEDLKIFSKCVNYTNTVIMKPDGTYMYNPERNGD